MGRVRKIRIGCLLHVYMGPGRRFVCRFRIGKGMHGYPYLLLATCLLAVSFELFSPHLTSVDSFQWIDSSQKNTSILSLNPLWKNSANPIHPPTFSKRNVSHNLQHSLMHLLSHLNKKGRRVEKKKNFPDVSPPLTFCEGDDDDDDASRSQTRQRALKTPLCPMLPKAEEEVEEENNARPPCGVCRTRGQKDMGWEKLETQPGFTTSQGGAKKDQTLPCTASRDCSP